MAASAAVCFAAVGVSYDAVMVHSLEVEAIKNRVKLDQNIPAKLIQYANSIEPTTDDDKLTKIRLLELARIQTNGADLSFKTHKKAVDEYIAAVKLEKEPSTERYLETICYWWMANRWGQEIYDLMKTMPGYKSWYDSGFICQTLGKNKEAYDCYMVTGYWPDRPTRIAIYVMKDPVKAFEAAKLINQRTLPASTVGDTINLVAAYLVGNPAISDQQMKDFLTIANRKYSGQLGNDEAAWSPVIKTIRTILQTY